MTVVKFCVACLAYGHLEASKHQRSCGKMCWAAGCCSKLQAVGGGLGHLSKIMKALETDALRFPNAFSSGQLQRLNTLSQLCLLVLLLSTAC